jgi:competence protein ComEA
VVAVPLGIRHGRLRVPWAAVAAALVVLLVAGAVFALRVVAAQRSATPVPVSAPSALMARSTPSAFASQTGAAAGGTLTAGVDPASPAPVVVDVVGQVAKPGVVTVPGGSRVVDVIAAAGGALPGADLERVNLARVVQDGEQLHVPAPGEAILPGSGGAVGSAIGTGAASSTAAKVSLNTADLAGLDSLPGVGPVLAQRILDWRAAHGRFTTVDELGEVSGIGSKLLAQLLPRVTL